MKSFFYIRTVDKHLYGVYEEITESELKEKVKEDSWLKVNVLNFMNYMEITDVTLGIMTDKIVSIEESSNGKEYMENLENEYECRYKIIKELRTIKMNRNLKVWMFFKFGILKFDDNEMGELSSQQLQKILDKCKNCKCKKI